MHFSSSRLGTKVQLPCILLYRGWRKQTYVCNLIEGVLHAILMIGNIVRNLCVAVRIILTLSQDILCPLVSKEGRSTGIIKARRYRDT